MSLPAVAQNFSAVKLFFDQVPSLSFNGGGGEGAVNLIAQGKPKTVKSILYPISHARVAVFQST